MPDDDIHSQEKENIKKYIEHTGASYADYNSLDEIFELPEELKPGVLFVDRTDISEVSRFHGTNTKIIYISKHSLLRRSDDQDILSKVDSVIFKPVNFSKIKRAISVIKKLKEQGINKEAEVIIDEGDNFFFKNLSILVAEDNIINQKLIKHTFSNLGAGFTLANNGRIAVDMRKKQNYDIIFMDVQMPVMDGVEATHTILEYEKIEEIPHIPIVALTANNLKGDRERLMNEGMDDFLSKPLELETVKVLLKSYFPEKVTYEDNHVDIILYKEKPLERKIFKSLFESMGYSVDAVVDIQEYKKKIQDIAYIYAFIDSSLFTADPKLINVLREKQIKSVMFADNPIDRNVSKHLIDDFACIVPSIADKKLLQYYLDKI